MFPWNLFPMNKDTKKMMQQMKPEEIQKHIQSMMGNMFPSNMDGMYNPQTANFPSKSDQSTLSKIETSVFETHDYVFIRIVIRNEEWMNNLKIYHTSNSLIIEHIPDVSDKHKVVLPAIVKKKGASARFKDGMLEVRMPKSNDMQFSEIDVSERL